MPRVCEEGDGSALKRNKTEPYQAANRHDGKSPNRAMDVSLGDSLPGRGSGGTRWRARRGLTRPTTPKRRPRRPKTAQEAAKTAQDAAKTAQETLKTIQERSKRAPRRPKSDRRDPQTTQDGLKTAQECSKTAQEAFQGRPQGAREAKILEKPMVFV